MTRGPDRLTLNLGGETLHLPTALLTIAAAGAAGWVALKLGTPLPWLLGALVVTATAGIAGLRPLGHVLGLPGPVRTAFVPVIGVAIGAAFTPDIAREALAWWPTLLALVAFIPLAHYAGYLVARRVGQVDPATAYYGMMPGGFVESIPLGEAAGADIAQLATFQFLRLILLIVLMPIGFSLATGHVVGSATGETIGTSTGLTLSDWGLLIAAGAVGGVGGRLLKIPAGIIMGPLLLSGLVHVLGWTEGGPPGWLIDATQLVIGASLGARFAGRSPRILWTGLRVVAVAVASMLALGSLFAALLHRAVGERWEAVFLAFAPGGLVEMALIALSLEISMIYVTGHHVVRIVLAVTVARALEARVIGTR